MSDSPSVPPSRRSLNDAITADVGGPVRPLPSEQKNVPPNPDPIEAPEVTAWKNATEFVYLDDDDDELRAAMAAGDALVSALEAERLAVKRFGPGACGDV